MDSEEKVCVVTGANSGLGLAVVRALARNGARVVMVCRDAGKGREASRLVRREFPDAALELQVCDLASRESIRAFLAAFTAGHARLDVLFNNAAVMKAQPLLTVDGLETAFQTNFVAPVMLMNGLRETLQRGSGRIINIAVPPEAARLEFDDLQSLTHYHPFLAFMRSKLCLLLYSLEMSRLWEGIGPTVNVIDPGPGPFQSNLAREFGGQPGNPPTPETAAGNVAWLALSQEAAGLTGRVFAGRTEMPLADYWKDPLVRERLMSLSEALLAQTEGVEH